MLLTCYHVAPYCVNRNNENMAGGKYPVTRDRKGKILKQPWNLIRLLLRIKIDFKTGCWNWTGCICHGYGMINDGTNRTAHRIMWILFYGSPPDGVSVCHSCNNKKCLNPNHLYLGTTQQNMRDASRDGLLKRSQKLSDEQIVLIRNSPKTCKVLAKEFNVSPQYVNLIKLGKRCTHNAYAIKKSPAPDPRRAPIYSE